MKSGFLVASLCNSSGGAVFKSEHSKDSVVGCVPNGTKVRAGRERRSVYLPKTKTGAPRTVPLSSRAVGLFSGMGPQDTGPVFESVPSSASQAFRRAVRRSGLHDLRFHDLRHEATSRLFERGLNVIEVARITGHKTLSMLDRYTHLDVRHLVQKLG